MTIEYTYIPSYAPKTEDDTHRKSVLTDDNQSIPVKWMQVMLDNEMFVVTDVRIELTDDNRNHYRRTYVYVTLGPVPQ